MSKRNVQRFVQRISNEILELVRVVVAFKWNVQVGKNTMHV
jgi:hypothetical protein